MTVTDAIAFFSVQAKPLSMNTPSHSTVSLKVKIREEDAMHDDFVSTNCCSLKDNKIPDHIIVWTKGQCATRPEFHEIEDARR